MIQAKDILHKAIHIFKGQSTYKLHTATTCWDHLISTSLTHITKLKLLKLKKAQLIS